MKQRNIHFISGLPRSGSTLLSNILAQNPNIHTTPTSACHEALFVMRNSWDQWIEHKASKELGARFNQQRVLNAILQNYHNTEKPVIIDKGRGWLSLLELTEFALGRKAKVLVPVRSIPQILSSFEKLWRKRAATGQAQGDYFQIQTIEGRAGHLLAHDQVLGLAYKRLKDAMQRGFSDRLHFVEFDDLTSNPKQKLTEIYDFLDLEPTPFDDHYEHDFSNIEQVTHEDDSVHGLDLHTIRSEVKPVPDDSVEILGADLARQFTGTEFWRKKTQP